MKEEKSFCPKWIAPHGTSTLPILRKRFFLADTVASAKVFISGLGLFELHINGRKAHDTYFEPGESVYEKMVFYSVFDVTSHLRPGENEITVYLGNGFYYNPPAQTDRLNREPAVLGEYMLLCQLEVNDLVYLCSDESWECADGTITQEETEVLLTMGKWLSINGEGIYGTTFWKTFGEGSVNAEEGFFKDGDEKQFTSEDFRFTYKDGFLYVFQMRPNKTAKIKTLRKHQRHNYLIESVTLLGTNEQIAFDRNEDCLEIHLKGESENDLPICFKMEIS